MLIIIDNDFINWNTKTKKLYAPSNKYHCAEDLEVHTQVYYYICHLDNETIMCHVHKIDNNK